MPTNKYFAYQPERALMRIVSLITAVAVVAILYVLVFERDVLNGFSDGKKIEELANDLGDGPELNSEEKCNRF